MFNNKKPLNHKYLILFSILINSAICFASTTECEVCPPIEKEKRITTGLEHTCAAYDDGTVGCWGHNAQAQLGQLDGNIIETNNAVFVLRADTGEPLTGISMVAAGQYHTCALNKTEGSVWCWGYTVQGQTGYTGSEYLSSNTQGKPLIRGALKVEGLDNIVSIGSGWFHSCAVKNDGSLYCWGKNKNYQLGEQVNEGAHNTAFPVLVSLINGATYVEGGVAHTCVLLDAGNVTCWGAIGKKQLGQNGSGQLNANRIPVNLEPEDFAIGLGVGGNHSCAILGGEQEFDTGRVKCWGMGSEGQLGYQTNSNSVTPNYVVGEGGMGLLNGVVDLAMGQYSTNSTSPYAFSCAVLSSGQARCWGSDQKATSGDGNGSSGGLSYYPKTVIDALFGGALEGVIEIDGFRDQIMGLVNARDGVETNIVSWGTDQTSEMGVGNSGIKNKAVYPSANNNTGIVAEICSTPRLEKHITTGLEHTCATYSDGTVGCWGHNAQAQLGQLDDSIVETKTPVFVVRADTGELLTDISMVAAGYQHTCGLNKTEGSVWCWGYTVQGQTGYAGSEYLSSNTQGESILRGALKVEGLDNIVSIGSGWFHSCAVKNDGSLYCWGKNQNYQLGEQVNGGAHNIAQPVLVSLIEGEVAIYVEAGINHTCVLMQSGEVSCWGANGKSQLGQNESGQLNANRVPVSLEANDCAIGLGVGGNHSCVVLEDGSVKCWGMGSDGQLGFQANDSSLIPDYVVGENGESHLKSVVDLTMGQYTDSSGSSNPPGAFTCAVLNNGEVRCWGAGDDQGGTSGDGSDPSIGLSYYPKTVIEAQSDNVLQGVKELDGFRDQILGIVEVQESEKNVVGWGKDQTSEMGVGSSGIKHKAVYPTEIDNTGL